MFYDRAKIYVRSGSGGDGLISFRREKHVPRGGPNGGDGGPGGDVVFRVNRQLSSLVRYHRQNHYRAGDGGHGGSNNKTGATGKSLILDVPPGTIIRDAETETLLIDLTSEEDKNTVLSGGQGGKGNARFASSTNQAPRLAERGEPGQDTWLLLELKLIADVGIVGVPNAGKSTLLSAVSAARPKIADYPFTTLEPNLGVVQLDDYQTFVLADIPGLIEGAASGAGLGHEFLRHVERTRLLIHLIDGMSSQPLVDWAMINQELTLHDAQLEEKPQLVVLNKIDLPDAQRWENKFQETMLDAGFPFFAISAVTGQGVSDLLYQIKRMIDEMPEAVPQISDGTAVIRPAPDDDAFFISREHDGWRIQGRRIERIAAMTYWEFEATTMRFQQILESMGITAALEKAGVVAGDTVYIGDETLEWQE